MELHEIEVIVDADGQVRLEVRGVKGEACLAATAALEQALGGCVVRRELTAEASEPATETGASQWLGGTR